MSLLLKKTKSCLSIIQVTAFTLYNLTFNLQFTDEAVDELRKHLVQFCHLELGTDSDSDEGDA